jgi:AAHS family 4-hydroxybenzoate transporter-like MFS transporter
MAQRLDVAEFIDSRKFSPYQWRVMIMCFVVVIVDGYDSQSTGFVVPLVSAAWHVSRPALGAMSAWGLGGLALGAILLGAAGDKFGRKRTILTCFMTFGVFTVAKCYSTTIGELSLFQFLAGIGAGGAMPNAFALIGEYSPKKRKALTVSLCGGGFSIGAAASGEMAAQFAHSYGWQGVFMVGGIVPLALIPVLMLALPESVRFLIVSGRNGEKVVKVLRKIDPTVPSADELELVSSEEHARSVAVVQLFQNDRAAMTAMLWFAVFADLLVVYFMTSWLPTAIHDVGGISLSDAQREAAKFSLAGMVGGPVVGYLMDRFGHVRMLAMSFFIGSIFITLIGYATVSLSVLPLVIFAAGFFAVGGHLGINALAGNLYPTFMRSTGIGWALGAGRFGSLISPIIGGMVLALHWPATTIFALVAVPAFIGSLSVLIVGKLAPASSPIFQRKERALTAALQD